MTTRQTTAGIIAGAILAGLVGLAPAARAQTARGTISSSQEIGSSNAKIAGVKAMASDIAIWQYAAQKWAADNKPVCHAGGACDGWNKLSSADPYSSATHKDQGQYVLLYAGPTPALCNPASVGIGSSQEIDLTQQTGYLPTGFGKNPPYSGEYCAVIEPNSGTAPDPQSTKTGLGGTPLVPIASVVAYFVAGSKTTATGLTAGVSAGYAATKSASLIEASHAGGGNILYSTGTGGSWAPAHP